MFQHKKSLPLFVLLMTLLPLSIFAQAVRSNCVIEMKGTASALFSAAESGDLEKVKRLLSSGANVDELHYQGDTALMTAAREGKNDILQVLLKAGANVNKQSDGWTALMWSSQKGRTQAIKILLASNALVDIQNNHGETALMWAARDGNLESVEVLLAAGANLNLKDDQGRTPFYYAAEGGKARTVEKFLGDGADPNFHSGENGSTVLMIATHDAETVRVLIKAGASVDATTDPLGMTALYIAAQNGWVETVKVLIGAGANVNAKYFDGETPLKRAMISKHSAVVDVLKAAGAIE